MARPDTYCPLPWQHLATHPHGGVTTCCISDHTDGLNRARNFKGEYDEFLSLNNDTIEQHMNKKQIKTSTFWPFIVIMIFIDLEFYRDVE